MLYFPDSTSSVDMIEVKSFKKSDITYDTLDAYIIIQLPDESSHQFHFKWFSFENSIEVGKKVKFNTQRDNDDKSILKRYHLDIETEYTVLKIMLKCLRK